MASGVELIQYKSYTVPVRLVMAQYIAYKAWIDILRSQIQQTNIQRGNTMYMTPEEIREKFPDAFIESDGQIGSDVRIGRDGQIGSDVRIGRDGQIGSDVRIGRDGQIG